jgi:hypothetical protein
MGHSLLLMGRRRRGRVKADDDLRATKGTDLEAKIAAAHDVEFIVRKLEDFEVSFGIVHSGLAHDLLHANQRGSIVSGGEACAKIGVFHDRDLLLCVPTAPPPPPPPPPPPLPWPIGW